MSFCTRARLSVMALLYNVMKKNLEPKADQLRSLRLYEACCELCLMSYWKSENVTMTDVTRKNFER